MPVTREESGTGTVLDTPQGDRVVGGRVQSDGGQWVVLVDENGFATLMSEGDLYDAEDFSVKDAEDTGSTGTTGKGSKEAPGAKTSGKTKDD